MALRVIYRDQLRASFVPSSTEAPNTGSPSRTTISDMNEYLTCLIFGRFGLAKIRERRERNVHESESAQLNLRNRCARISIRNLPELVVDEEVEIGS